MLISEAGAWQASAVPLSTDLAQQKDDSARLASGLALRWPEAGFKVLSVGAAKDMIWIDLSVV